MNNYNNKNNGNYLVGMVCLFSSLIFFSYSAYMLPYLLFNWHYSVPDFVLSWVHIMKIDYHFGGFLISCIVFFSFFTPGLILIMIANIISNKLESHLVPVEPVLEENNHIKDDKMSDGMRLTLKILGLIFFIFMIVRMLEWAISR